MIQSLVTTILLAGMSAVGLTVAQPEAVEQFNTLPEVHSYSSGGRSYLGVDIQDITADRLAALKLKEEHGVEVTMVDQDAPAGKAGVKEHDVILQFNGTAVESEEQLRRMLRETPPGRTVTLGISRDGNLMNITLQLADRGKIVTEVQPRIVVPRVPRIPDIEVPGFALQMQTYSSTLGVQTENLSRQLGEYFGVKNGEGVLVRSVEKGSAAEKAGLKAGDVIVRADNEKLSDRADLSQALRNHREGGKLTLGIVRDKHEQTVTVDLPHRGSDDSFIWSFPNQELQSDWNELRDEMREMIRDQVQTQTALATKIAEAQLRETVRKAEAQARAAEPKIRAAQRQAQIKLRELQRSLEKHQREMQRSLNQMI